MTLVEEIKHAINRCNRESQSNTPDFILAQFLEGCLIAFETSVQRREQWYGRDPRSMVPRPLTRRHGGTGANPICYRKEDTDADF